MDLPEGTLRLFWRLGGEDGHTPIHEPDVLVWAGWLEMTAELPSERSVGYEQVGDRVVSTAFLGMAMGISGMWGTPPLLFETAIFTLAGEGLAAVDLAGRYSTWDEAAAGHAVVVARLQAGGDEDA